MKSTILVSLVAALAISCSESRESKNQEVPLSFDKTIGQQIPLDVAERWRKRSSSTASRETSPHTIKAETLASALSPISDKVGVAFQHALDDDGVYHVILVPMIEGNDLSDANVFIDTNTDFPVQKSTAVQWADNYRALHPNEVLYHFFGIGIFQEIQNNPLFNYIHVEPAINDEGLGQLLLFVWNNSDMENGKVNGDELVVYDFSSPCPPCSSQVN
jgi:hypothetical protein